MVFQSFCDNEYHSNESSIFDECDAYNHGFPNADSMTLKLNTNIWSWSRSGAWWLMHQVARGEKVKRWNPVRQCALRCFLFRSSELRAKPICGVRRFGESMGHSLSAFWLTTSHDVLVFLSSFLCKCRQEIDQLLLKMEVALKIAFYERNLSKHGFRWKGNLRLLSMFL